MSAERDPHDFSALRDMVLEERATPLPEVARLSDNERAAIRQSLVARFGRPAGAAASAAEDAAFVPPRATVTRLSPRAAALSSISVAVAIAASVFFWVRREPSPLPDYELEGAGAAATHRGDVASNSFIDATGPDTRVEFILRPEHAATEPVTALAFVEHDGVFRKADVTVEVSPSGSVRILGSSQSFRGASALKIIVARGSALEQASAMRAAKGERIPGARAFSIPVR